MSYGTEQRWPRGVRRVASALFVTAWLLIAVAGLAELFLVDYAERRVARSIERDATGVSVRIEARPAAKLLLGRADRVVVRVAELRSRDRGSAGSAGGLGDLLARTSAAGSIDARVDTLVGPRLTLHDVRLGKDGDRLSGSATVTRRAVRAALPARLALSPSGGEDGFALQATARLLGRSVSVGATVTADRGRLVIAPRAGGVTILTLAIFDDARVSVDRVRAAAVAGGYRFAAEGHLT